jgi:hypothetical protein
LRFGAAEPREPTGGFTFDQRLERLAKKGRPFVNISQLLSPGEQFIIKSYRRTHPIFSEAPNIASSDAHFHAHSPAKLG